MIHTQPAPPRRYYAPGVATQITQDDGHCAANCPRCNSGVVRIPRRFIDRLINIVYPVYRYRCQSFLCSWEGNLAIVAQPSIAGRLGAEP